MSKPEIKSEAPISMVEVKGMLSKVKKRDGELSFRANKAEEYLNQFATISQKKTDELKKRLEGLGVPRLKENHIIKLIDLMPDTADDVKLVLSSFQTLTVSQDNQKKLAKAISEYT